MIRKEFAEALDGFFSNIEDSVPVDVPESSLVYLLEADDPDENALLFARARAVRDRHSGPRMVVRGLVEFSSYCRNTCFYCGLNRENPAAERYRLTVDEILTSARLVAEAGIRTIVLQSGEDCYDAEELARAVRAIRERYDIAITLSVGERPREDYALWRKAGADRYLLRVEATDADLYSSLHEGRELSTRLECLQTLRELGYQVGSGVMVGPPGQTTGQLARDIRFLASREFDMIGVGPFIPHPDTPFRGASAGDVKLTLRVVALLRLITRNAWLPATTALGSMDRDYRIDALNAGANVLMPNFSPFEVKKKYEIYPGKRCVTERTGACAECTEVIARAAGLGIDWSRADSLKMQD